MLLCNDFNDALIFTFSFKYFESVVLYIISLEVARELSRFCEMVWWSEVVRPHWIKLLSSTKTIVVNISLQTWTEEEWKVHRGRMKSSKISQGRNASKKVGNHWSKISRSQMNGLKWIGLNSHGTDMCSQNHHKVTKAVRGRLIPHRLCSQTWRFSFPQIEPFTFFGFQVNSLIYKAGSG